MDSHSPDEPEPVDGIDHDELMLREHSGLGATGEAPILLPEPQPSRPVGAWILILALAAAGAGGVYVFLNRQRPAPVAPVSSATPAPVAVEPPPPPPARPFGGDVTPIDLPPLDQSDSVISTLVKALSSHPRVVAWLATKGLIRNFTLVVFTIAEGKAPGRHLQTLRLSSPFLVTGSGSGVTGDAGNYRRYDPLAAAVASIDPTAAVRLYGSIKPSIAEAYRELGYPDMPFDGALERAIVVLLETPAPDPAARLVRAPKGIGYRFADPRVEALPEAQKQLLRTGPANVQAIQTWLRAVAAALGIPEARLPARRG